MAKINVAPDIPNPPYDIELTDGKEYIGLIADADELGRNPVEQSSLKTSQGNQSYSDLEPPYMVVAQDDWTGGRASREFEKDVTRYKDALRANTERATGVILAGRETYGTGLRDEMRSLPGNMRLTPLVEGRRYMAKRVTPDTSMDAARLWFWIRRKGTPKGALTIKLRDDASGAIDAVLQTTTLAIDDTDNLVSELWVLTITSETVSGACWVEVIGASGDSDENHWEVGVLEDAGTTKKSSDGITYESDTIDLYYRVTEADTQTGGYYFEFKKGWYFMTKPADGSASELWINGARGMAVSNAGNLDKLITSAAHGLTAAQATGAVIVVIEGTGSTEEQNWRTITGVPTTSQFSVDEDWLITHDATTTWVVVGANVWNEIDVSSVITVPVTCVWVASNDFVYFCQGELDEIARMKEENVTGTWTRTLANESTYKALHLTEYTSTGQKFVRTNVDGTAGEAAVPTSWTDITGFTSPAIAVGNKWDRFTGAEPYKDYNLDDIVVLFKEGGPWQWKAAVADSMSTPEMAAITSAKNGMVHGRQGSYLYYSVQNTLWRFYTPNHDDIGPTADEGLPTLRQGPISGFAAYPGRVLISVDGGDSGYSGVFSNTGGSSWHEMYRAPKGERIRGIGFQIVPGAEPDRLWIRQGADLVYIPFPSETYDPYQDAEYPFTHEFVLEIGEITAGLYDAYKYWKELKLRTQNLIEDETTGVITTWIEADYRLSDSDEWITFPEVFSESPVQEQDFDREFGASSQILYLRLRGYSTDTSESPKLTAAAISGVTVTPPKFSYQLTAKCTLQDKNGSEEDISPAEKVKRLDTWCGQARPLRMYTTNPLFHDIQVFIMPLPVRPRSSAQKVNEFEYNVTLILQEA